VKKIVLIWLESIPASTRRRVVPMPQSISYSRPLTIRRVEGSDRSNLSGGPPAVPRKRIWVRDALGPGAAVREEAAAQADSATKQRRMARPDISAV